MMFKVTSLRGLEMKLFFGTQSCQSERPGLGGSVDSAGVSEIVVVDTTVLDDLQLLPDECLVDSRCRCNQARNGKGMRTISRCVARVVDYHYNWKFGTLHVCKGGPNEKRVIS